MVREEAHGARSKIAVENVNLIGKVDLTKRKCYDIMFILINKGFALTLLLLTLIIKAAMVTEE